MLRHALRVVVVTLAFAFSAGPIGGVVAGEQHAAAVDLLPNVPSGQPVGTTITWTVTTDSPDPTSYRLLVALRGQPLRVMYDFSPKSAFEWTPIEDGIHNIVLAARDDTSGTIVNVARRFLITSRVTTQPIVTSTLNPLVALYSAPPCDVDEMVVVFKPQTGGPPQATAPKPCRSGHSMNFYVAGMRADTDYWIRHATLVGGVSVELGPTLSHRTGSLPITLPTISVLDPPDAQTSPEPALLVSPITGPFEPSTRYPFATDLAGRVIWFDDRAVADEPHLFRPVDGGTMLTMQGREGVADQVLREIDLAGNTVRETTAARISEQLATMGYTDPFTAFHHEARRLPDGRTAVLGAVERIMTDVQGPGDLDVLSDYIVVLDGNWQVVWAWSGFDHLDVTRLAVLGETCVSEGPGCPPIFLGDIANDWLHSNAIAHSPSDGNLLLSMRHQDWVIKIDYRDGAGDGHVVWRLGPEGDFSLDSADPFPWFSHQHDPNLTHTGEVAVYDNGNTRCAQASPCNSRGQVYALDETTMTASPVVNADLGNYSAALGSAQALSNGNFHFNSGFQSPPNFTGWSDEVVADGTKAFSLQILTGVYRSFRMRDLYTSPKP